MSMKVKQKQKPAFGDLITAEYHGQETCQAEKLVRMASNACLVLFREPPYFSTSATKGRFA